MTDFAPPRPPSNRPPSLAELSAGKLGAPGTTVSSGTKLFDPSKVKLGSQAPPAPRGLLTQVWDVIRGAPMGLVQLGGKAAQTVAAPLHYTYDMAFNRDDHDSVDGVGDFLNQYMPVVDLLADSAGETLGRIRHPSRYLDAIEEGRIVDAILNDVGNIALAGGAVAKGVGSAGSATTAASLRSTIQAGVADGTIGQTAAQAALRGAARVEQGSGIAGALSRSGNVAAAERLTGVGNVIRQGTRTLNTIADTPFPAVRWAGGKLGDIAAPAVERVVSARLERPYTIPRQGGRIPLSEVLRHSVVGTDLANSRVVSRLTPQGRDFQQNISADLVNRTLQAQMAVSEVGTAAEQLARDNDLPASRQDPTYLRLTSAAVLDTFGVLEQQLQGWTARYNAAADQVQRDAVFEDIYNEVTRLYADAPDSRVIPRPEVVRTILDERSGTLAPNERAFIAGMRPAVAKLYAQGEQMGVEGIGGRKITDEEMGSEVLSIEAQRQRAARERELAAVDRQMVGQRERAARDERLANVQRAVAEAFDDPPALKGITDRQRAAARQDVELARAQDALREERRSLRELQSRLRQEVRDGAADVDRRITEVERAVARVNELRTLEAAALARWREAQAATPPDTPPPGGPVDPPPQPPTPDGGVPPVAPAARAVEPEPERLPPDRNNPSTWVDVGDDAVDIGGDVPITREAARRRRSTLLQKQYEQAVPIAQRTVVEETLQGALLTGHRLVPEWAYSERGARNVVSTPAMANLWTELNDAVRAAVLRGDDYMAEGLRVINEAPGLSIEARQLLAAQFEFFNFNEVMSGDGRDAFPPATQLDADTQLQLLRELVESFEGKPIEQVIAARPQPRMRAQSVFRRRNQPLKLPDTVEATEQLMEDLADRATTLGGQINQLQSEMQEFGPYADMLEQELAAIDALSDAEIRQRVTQEQDRIIADAAARRDELANQFSSTLMADPQGKWIDHLPSRQLVGRDKKGKLKYQLGWRKTTAQGQFKPAGGEWDFLSKLSDRDRKFLAKHQQPLSTTTSFGPDLLIGDYRNNARNNALPFDESMSDLDIMLQIVELARQHQALSALAQPNRPRTALRGDGAKFLRPFYGDSLDALFGDASARVSTFREALKERLINESTEGRFQSADYYRTTLPRLMRQYDQLVADLETLDYHQRRLQQRRGERLFADGFDPNTPTEVFGAWVDAAQATNEATQRIERNRRLAETQGLALPGRVAKREPLLSNDGTVPTELPPLQRTSSRYAGRFGDVRARRDPATAPSIAEAAAPLRLEQAQAPAAAAPDRINYFNRALSEWDQSLADLAEMRRRAEAGQLTNAEFSELTGGINASRFAMGGTASKSVPRKLQDAVAYVERMVIAARSRTITRARNEGVELADAQPPVAPEAAVPPRPVPSIAEVAAPLRPEQPADAGTPPPPDTPPTQAAGGGDAPPPGPDVVAAQADYEATRGRRLEAQRNQRSVVGRLVTADKRARQRLSDANPATPRTVVYRDHGRVDPDTAIGEARADAVPSLAKLDQQEVSSRVQRAQQRVANAERNVEVKRRTATIARSFAELTDDEKTLYAKYRRPRDRNGNVRAASVAENINRRLGAVEERARVSAARLKQLEDRRTAVLREIADIPVTLSRPVQARIRDLVHGRSKTLSLNDQGLTGPIKPGDWIELPNGKWGRVVEANMEVVLDAQGRVVIDKATGEPQEQLASWEVDMGGGTREQVEPGGGWRWRSDRGGAVGTLRRQLRNLAPPVGTVRTIEVDTWKDIDPEQIADMNASGMGETRYVTEVRGRGLIYNEIMAAAARSGVDPVRIVQNIEALPTDRARIVALGEAADDFGFTPEQIDLLNRSVDIDERMVVLDSAVASSHAEGTWIDLPLELGRLNEDLGWAPQEWHNARHKQMHRFVDARVRTLADDALSVQAMPARWRPVAIMARRQIKVMLDDAQRLSDEGLNARPLLAMAAEIATNMADLAALNIDPRYVIGGVPARMGQAVDSLRPRPLRSDYQRRTPYAPLDLEDMQATQLETMVQRHRNHTYAEAERRYGRSLSQIPELTDWLTTFVQDNNRYPSSNEFIDAAKQAGWVPLQRGRGLGATEAVDLVGQLDEDLRLASELHEQAIASGDTARIQRTRFQMEEVASRLERAKRVTPVELRNAWQAFDRARQDMERLAAQGADTDALAAAQTRLDNATMVLGEAEAAALPTLVPDAIATEMARDASLWDRGMLPGFKLLAKSNRFFKNQVLPLSFRWYLNNALGNVLMAAAFGGVGPRQLATMVGQLIKTTGVTGAGRRSQIRVEQALLSGALDVGTVRGARIQQSGLLESQRRGLGLDQWDQASDPRTRVGRGVRAVTDRGYGINEFMDNMYRSSVYLAKIENYIVKGARNKLDVATPEGVQRVAEAALRDTLKAMGDYTNMAPWQRKYLRQIFPWWSWIRHSTIAAMRLPVENPIRTLWLAQLSGLANEEGLSGEELAFFGGRWMLDDGRSIPLVSLSPLEDVTQNPIFNPPGLIRSIAPAIKIATVATTGLDLGRITQVSQPPDSIKRGVFGQQVADPLIYDPAALAGYAVGQFPMLRNLRDVLEQPSIRYGTGQPILDKQGAPKPSGRTRLGSLAAIFGIPTPETMTISEAQRRAAERVKLSQ